ncbi:PAS domain S-box protein [Proteiniclasticum sp. C24MP]|uniref:PAS domain S-box protein n=1 Tax=Proteiniclasticum sp. C24MP TaxID=3374101 RepID=UPI003754553E
MERADLTTSFTYKNIMDYSSTMIQSVDLECNLIYTNEAWRDTLGYSPAQVERRSLFSVLSSKSHKTYQNIMSMVRSGKEPGNQDLIYLMKSGKETVLSGMISLMKDHEGEVIGTTGFLKLSAYIDEPFDMKIPDRGIEQRAHSVVKDMKTKYGSDMLMGLEDLESPINRFLDSIYDLVFFKDVDGYYRGCNNNFAALLNLPKEKIIGYTDYDLYPDAIADLFREKDALILKDLTPRKNEEWVTLSDGTKSFLETLKTPYWGPNNELTGFLGISRDITERKLAEDKLAENEMWLNIYFTQSNNAKFFLMLDHPVSWKEVPENNRDQVLKEICRNLKINRINPALLDLYGITEEEIRNEKVPASILCDPEEGIEELKALLDQSNLRVVFEKERKDGKEIAIAGDYMCLYDDQEHLIGIFGNHRDITKEVLSEKETKERELYLRTVLETTRDGYYALDEELKIIDVNEAYCGMCGYTKEELIGMSIMKHTIMEDAKSAREKAQRIYERGSELFESRHRKKDGTIFDVEVSVSTLEGKERKLIHFIRDITERKQLESYFLIEKDLFKNTIHSAADAVISTDSYGNVVIMNNMAETFTGWTQEEAKGRPLEEVLHIHDQHGNHFTNIARESMRSRNKVELVEDYRLLTKGHEEVFIELSAAPITGSENEIIGAVVIFKDITRRREEMKNIEDLSYRDALTGLFNRRYLNEAVKSISDILSLPLTVMVVDVNGLKLTNDAFGHATGDKLLKEVATIIKEVTRQEDVVCRTGGDEFILLLPNSDRAQAKALKDRIVSLASKTKVDSLSVSLAIGYSVMRRAEEDFDDVFTEADNNMYRNKLRYGQTIKRKTIDKLLNKLNRKNHEMFQHNREVTEYAEKLGMAMGLKENVIEDLRLAARLHDIGKVMVSKDILQKAGKLTDKEISQIRKHSEIGYQLLKEVDDYKHLAEIVLSHHEWYNGNGYPRKLKGEEIPLLSRIIAVADSYETMTGIRGYRTSITKEEAVAELKSCAGTQFDPVIVDLFVDQVLG